MDNDSKKEKGKNSFLKTQQKSLIQISMGFMLFLISIVLFFIFRKTARRTACVGNIFQIKLALRMYSNAYNENFPNLDGVDGLELLRKTGFLEAPQCYVCPSSGTKPGKMGEPLTEKTVDYIYRGGYNENDNINIGILYDKKHNHHKYGNIAFIDGHVGRFFGDDWQKHINSKNKNSEKPTTAADIGR